MMLQETRLKWERQAANLLEIDATVQEEIWHYGQTDEWKER